MFPSFPNRHSKVLNGFWYFKRNVDSYSFNSSGSLIPRGWLLGLMDTPRSSTPVTEPGASESLFDSTRLILSPQLSPSGTSSAVRGQTGEGGVQRNKSTLREHAATLIKPPKKVGPPPTAWQSIRAILLASCKLFS